MNAMVAGDSFDISNQSLVANYVSTAEMVSTRYDHSNDNGDLKCSKLSSSSCGPISNKLRNSTCLTRNDYNHQHYNVHNHSHSHPNRLKTATTAPVTYNKVVNGHSQHWFEEVNRLGGKIDNNATEGKDAGVFDINAKRIECLNALQKSNFPKEDVNRGRWRQCGQPGVTTLNNNYNLNNDCDLIESSYVIKFLCYFSYAILILFGYFRMFLEWFSIGVRQVVDEKYREGYTPLYRSWQGFFTRYIYRRVADIFGQPITGNPGGVVKVLDRKSTDGNYSFKLTGISYDCINLASYDYLGFSRGTADSVNSVIDIIHQYGVGVAPTHELGRLDKHQELEHLFAQFLGVEACMIFGMGFATNSTNIPTLVYAGCLVIADQNSHASAKSGIYLSGATFRCFKHNDCDDLERKLRKAIVEGDPVHREPWKKIIIIVEGVYSMEGTIVNLPRLIELKKRYRCYLYVDEAHSIGAIGPHGRGIVDYFGCDPNDVDLLMGTMTKSFAAAGGYIAGSKQLIDHIRMHSASNYAGTMAAPIAQQVINTVKTLLDKQSSDGDGQKRIQTLLWNTHYMRQKLKQLGFIIHGNHDSPVIPIMIYLPAKVGSIVRMAVRNGLALVCAGYPATSLTTCRIRLCMTAAHTKETLDRALQILNKIGDVHQIKYAKY